MNKLALFVEGRTEQLFVDSLIQAVAAKNSVHIELRKILGGTSCPRRNITLQTTGPSPGMTHFVLIHDCGGDSAVKTRMREEYDSLSKSGYCGITCLRDVYPFTHTDIQRLENSLPLYVKTKPILVEFILSIMEIESWFLSEHTHFEKIDPRITVEAIKTTIGFDPSVDDMMLRQQPANDLASCYQIAGKSYKKGDGTSTLQALDYAALYLETSTRIPYLNKFCKLIECFLTT